MTLGAGMDMESIPIAAWIALLVLGNVAIVVFMYRQKKGRFRVLQEDARRFRFVSNFGDITIDGPTRAVNIRAGKKGATIPFDQIHRLDYGMKTSTALAEEIWNGLDLWDLTGMYRDVNNWFQLSAVLHGGQKVPLYVVGQYEPKEPFSEWWFELQRGMLRLVGLFKDVDKTSLAVVKRVQRAFADCGKPLSLV